MDVDTTVLQSAFVFGGAERPVTGSLQTSAGLTRYHSAPSALFANLLDDEVFCHEPSQLSQADESEFTRFLCGELEPASAPCNTRQMDESGVVIGFGPKEVRGLLQSERGMEQSPYLFNVVGGALSSISEHCYEESSDNSHRHHLPLAVEQQVIHQGPPERTSPPIHSCKTGSIRPPQAKSTLIRHSSSPADFLSSLLMEDNFPLLPDMVVTTSKGSRKSSAGSALPVHPATIEESVSGNGFSPAAVNPMQAMTGIQSSKPNSLVDGLSASMSGGFANIEYSSGVNRNGLLRQSSSPARFLSQWSSEALSPSDEKISMSSSSGDSVEENLVEKGRFYANRVATSAWDEAGSSYRMEDDGVVGQRKRGRGLVTKTTQGMATANPHGLPIEDSVLCKTRAPRGCATHPRSIAERVRRTKISDKMKKLQELVPNNDKQTNIVDMLDEAVEYVKFLQRQVQELSQNRCKCDGKHLPKASP